MRPLPLLVVLSAAGGGLLSYSTRREGGVDMPKAATWLGAKGRAPGPRGLKAKSTSWGKVLNGCPNRKTDPGCPPGEKNNLFLGQAGPCRIHANGSFCSECEVCGCAAICKRYIEMDWKPYKRGPKDAPLTRGECRVRLDCPNGYRCIGWNLLLNQTGVCMHATRYLWEPCSYKFKCLSGRDPYRVACYKGTLNPEQFLCTPLGAAGEADVRCSLRKRAGRSRRSVCAYHKCLWRDTVNGMGVCDWSSDNPLYIPSHPSDPILPSHEPESHVMTLTHRPLSFGGISRENLSQAGEIILSQANNESQPFLREVFDQLTPIPPPPPLTDSTHPSGYTMWNDTLHMFLPYTERAKNILDPKWPGKNLQNPSARPPPPTRANPPPPLTLHLYPFPDHKPYPFDNHTLTLRQSLELTMARPRPPIYPPLLGAPSRRRFPPRPALEESKASRVLKNIVFPDIKDRRTWMWRLLISILKSGDALAGISATLGGFDSEDKSDFESENVTEAFLPSNITTSTPSKPQLPTPRLSELDLHDQDSLYSEELVDSEEVMYSQSSGDSDRRKTRIMDEGVSISLAGSRRNATSKDANPTGPQGLRSWISRYVNLTSGISAILEAVDIREREMWNVAFAAAHRLAGSLESQRRSSDPTSIREPPDDDAALFHPETSF